MLTTADYGHGFFAKVMDPPPASGEFVLIREDALLYPPINKQKVSNLSHAQHIFKDYYIVAPHFYTYLITDGEYELVGYCVPNWLSE